MCRTILGWVLGILLVVLIGGLLVYKFYPRMIVERLEDFPVRNALTQRIPSLLPSGEGEYLMSPVRNRYTTTVRYEQERDPLMYTDDGMYYHDLAWGWPLYTTYWTGGGFYGGPYNQRWNGGAAAYPWTTNVDGVQRNKLEQ